jgi:riboflavin transporter
MNLKEISIEKEGIGTLVNTLIILGVAVIVPMFHNQFATGPIVNAVLFISTVLLGLEKTLFICLIPSVIAMSVGLLPPVLAPMVPFIMISNVLMVFVFFYTKKINYWVGMVSASFVKFLFLYITSFAVVNLVVKKDLATAIVSMMSWPQLLTALAGGVLAYFFLKFIKKDKYY